MQQFDEFVFDLAEDGKETRKRKRKRLHTFRLGLIYSAIGEDEGGARKKEKREKKAATHHIWF